MTDERLAVIRRDWQEQEPGFYAREHNTKMVVIQELLAEVTRLRAGRDTARDAALGKALREAVKETDAGEGCYLYVSACLASLRIKPGHLVDTDATRALSAALSAQDTQRGDAAALLADAGERAQEET